MNIQERIDKLHADYQTKKEKQELENTINDRKDLLPVVEMFKDAGFDAEEYSSTYGHIGYRITFYTHPIVRLFSSVATIGIYYGEGRQWAKTIFIIIGKDQELVDAVKEIIDMTADRLYQYKDELDVFKTLFIEKHSGNKCLFSGSDGCSDCVNPLIKAGFQCSNDTIYFGGNMVYRKNRIKIFKTYMKKLFNKFHK